MLSLALQCSRPFVVVTHYTHFPTFWHLETFTFIVYFFQMACGNKDEWGIVSLVYRSHKKCSFVPVEKTHSFFCVVSFKNYLWKNHFPFNFIRWSLWWSFPIWESFEVLVPLKKKSRLSFCAPCQAASLISKEPSFFTSLDHSPCKMRWWSNRKVVELLMETQIAARFYQIPPCSCQKAPELISARMD